MHSKWLRHLIGWKIGWPRLLRPNHWLLTHLVTAGLGVWVIRVAYMNEANWATPLCEVKAQPLGTTRIAMPLFPSFVHLLIRMLTQKYCCKNSEKGLIRQLRNSLSKRAIFWIFCDSTSVHVIVASSHATSLCPLQRLDLSNAVVKWFTLTLLQVLL